MIFQEPLLREDKPSFDDIPQKFIHDIETFFGAKILRGETVFGSLSASASFKIYFDDGRIIFAKGNHPAEMAHGTLNLRQEIQVYETVPILKQISPRYLGTLNDGDEDGWMLAFFQALDVSVTPPSLDLFNAAIFSLQQEQIVPLPDYRDMNFINMLLRDEMKWRRLRDDKKARDLFLTLFADTHAAQIWFDQNIETLVMLQSAALSSDHPLVLMHGDLRLDNILYAESKLFLVDWPNACRGPAVFDPIFLFAHLDGMEVALFDHMIGSFLQKRPDGHKLWPDIYSVMSHLSGYFATQAYRAVPDKMPRLRWMQKTMLVSLLRNLAGFGQISAPPRFK